MAKLSAVNKNKKRIKLSDKFKWPNRRYDCKSEERSS